MNCECSKFTGVSIVLISVTNIVCLILSLTNNELIVGEYEFKMQGLENGIALSRRQYECRQVCGWDMSRVDNCDGSDEIVAYDKHWAAVGKLWLICSAFALVFSGLSVASFLSALLSTQIKMLYTSFSLGFTSLLVALIVFTINAGIHECTADITFQLDDSSLTSESFNGQTGFGFSWYLALSSLLLNALGLFLTRLHATADLSGGYKTIMEPKRSMNDAAFDKELSVSSVDVRGGAYDIMDAGSGFGSFLPGS